MKKGTKLTLGLVGVALGAVVLSGCTKSFCSQVDQARMKYAFEPGITRIEAKEGGEDVVFTNGEYTYTLQHAQYIIADWEPLGDGTDPHKGSYVLSYTNIDGKEVTQRLKYFNNILNSSRSNGYVTIDDNSREYLVRFDYLALNAIFSKALNKNEENITLDLADANDYATYKDHLSYYSYARFANGNTGSPWKNWNEFNYAARESYDGTSVLNNCPASTRSDELSPEICPSSDFVKYYKSQINSYISAYRTCLTIYKDKYGSYGYAADEGIYIDNKTWGEAWSKGLFEGLLVYPIGSLVDVIVKGFRGTGLSNGVAAFLGIVFVTFIIRAIMLLLTFKQTQSNAKMTELQPEITKIQNKYPNSNTSQVEKQRMAEEMNRLYKKNKVNPFMTLIVLVVQFPIFICVWGALSGSAQLTNGTILGLNLSHTIRQVLLAKEYWTAAGGYAAVTALFLFLLMAGAQTVSMLLPQWIQKKKQKEVASLGKNPAQKSQNNKMKWFTYIMLALIIFMGFSLVSAMGIYWFIGAIFSIIQTLIMELVSKHKKHKKA